MTAVYSEITALVEMGIVAEQRAKWMIDRRTENVNFSAFATHPVKVVEIFDVSVATETVFEVARALCTTRSISKRSVVYSDISFSFKCF